MAISQFTDRTACHPVNAIANRHSHITRQNMSLNCFKDYDHSTFSSLEKLLQVFNGFIGEMSGA
jgi:hypothetical protein